MRSEINLEINHISLRFLSAILLWVGTSQPNRIVATLEKNVGSFLHKIQDGKLITVEYLNKNYIIINKNGKNTKYITVMQIALKR